MKAILTVLIWGLVVLGMPSNAFAHSVETDYTVLARSRLDIAVKFSTGEPFESAPVQVYAPNNATKPWMTDQTDRQGHFAFLPDTAISGDWTVKIGQVNSDHGDILNVPVSQQGIDGNRISEGVDSHPQSSPGALGFIFFSSVIGANVWAMRQKSGLVSRLRSAAQRVARWTHR